MSRIKEESLLTMDGWPGGVNNRSQETEPTSSSEERGRMSASLFLREAVNVDLTKFGHPIRRKGRKKLVTGYTHSLWSHESLSYGLCVHEGWLSILRDSGALEQLVQVHAYAPVSYATVNSVVYWGNGVQKGRVVDGAAHEWGLPVPPELTATVTSGSLSPGTYRVSSVYVDEFGEEYGASRDREVQLQEGEGLSLSVNGPWAAEAVTQRLFVSQPDSEILYEVAEVAAPSTVVVQKSMLGRGRELETANLEPPKAGTIVRYFNGRVYIARRDVVSFTEALRYGLTRPSQGVYMFSSDVTLLEPVVDGVYVGNNEGVVFLSGLDPYDVRQVTVLNHAPVKRASVRVPGEFFEVQGGDVPVWWGKDGAMVVGLPGGQVQQLTKDRLATPAYGAGSLLYREQNGMAQVVASMGKGGDVSGLAAQDSVVATVRRNTKKLNC